MAGPFLEVSAVNSTFDGHLLERYSLAEVAAYATVDAYDTFEHSVSPVDLARFSTVLTL